MEGLAGIVILYLTLVGIGIVTCAFGSVLAQRYLWNLRQHGTSLFWRGLATTLVGVLLIGVLGMIGREANESGERAVGLVIVVLLLLYGLAFLVGYGALAWHLGERVALIFGKAEVAPGWAIMLGSALILSVVWVPLIGWALGVYWVCLCVGNVVAGLSLTGEPSNIKNE